MKRNSLLVIVILLHIQVSYSNNLTSRPHIIFIMVDDVGWNDLGFHGSNQFPTPNIDALAYNGVILNNYYVLPVCTPSRSALMTGRYPIHNGMQHRVLYGAEPRGLPLNETLLPQYLKLLGYSTHILGKWHLGSYKLEYTPLYRGFDTHLGFWTGHQDYYDHNAVETGYCGLDMRRGVKPAWDLHGKYTTHIIADEAEKLISNYNSSKPMFLYLSHAAAHSGNPYEPLRAPDSTIARFGYIEDFQRRKFAAIMAELDDSVGRVMTALRQKNMLKNSIIVFSSDNGGPAAGFNLNAASNWPLRGTKNTLWEGGVRGAAFIWSPRIKSSGRVSRQMMHITDWLPTLYAAAGGDPNDLRKQLDGVNMWKSLVHDLPSVRNEILLNIDDIYEVSSLILDEWKIMKGTTYNGDWDGWYGPSGREEGLKYDIGQVLGSKANKAISSVMNTVKPSEVRTIRENATVRCGEQTINPCNPLAETCLYNVNQDPCEMNNLAKRYPNLVAQLEKVMAVYNKSAVAPSNKPIEERGNPARWNFVWTNFGDYTQ